VAKIRHKKKGKKKPHWRWCSPPLATHVFISIIIFQRSWNTREEPGLGQVFEEDHLKAHEFCKRNANAKHTFIVMKKKKNSFVLSWSSCILVHLSFKFLFKLSAIRSSSLALYAGMSEWVRRRASSGCNMLWRSSLWWVFTFASSAASVSTTCMWVLLRLELCNASHWKSHFI